MKGKERVSRRLWYIKKISLFKSLTELTKLFGALALGLSSELPTLRGQLARRSTAKLCHNQVHMTCGSHRPPGSHPCLLYYKLAKLYYKLAKLYYKLAKLYSRITRYNIAPEASWPHNTTTSTLPPNDVLARVCGARAPGRAAMAMPGACSICQHQLCDPRLRCKKNLPSLSPTPCRGGPYKHEPPPAPLPARQRHRAQVTQGQSGRR